MFNISFVVKNKKYKLNIEKGEDVLLALDNFVKNNKLEFTHFENVKMRCLGPKDSVSCRIGRIITFVLNEA